MMETTSELTIEQVAEKARSMLGGHSEPIYLSRLGQDLGKALGISVRNVLGQTRLGDFITEYLGDEYEVWGQGPHKMVGRKGTPRPSDTSRVRFDPAVWAAFNKPLAEGLSRWLYDDRPFGFDDAVRPPPGRATTEVPQDLIVPDEIQSENRRAAILDAISIWCDANERDPRAYQASAGRASPEDRTSGKAVGGVHALKQLIQSIPAEERAGYSLPLNLVGRLLGIR